MTEQEFEYVPLLSKTEGDAYMSVMRKNFRELGTRPWQCGGQVEAGGVVQSRAGCSSAFNCVEWLGEVGTKERLWEKLRELRKK